VKTMEKAQIQQYRWKLESRREDAVRLLVGWQAKHGCWMLTLRKTLAANPSAVSLRNLYSSKLANAGDWSE
jgi:hypothetical protein